jgi:60 kDa SS-A/Ro ribonucleoprotein
MNKSLFTSSPVIPQADTVNNAGGSAYAYTPEHALVQYAVTGCLNGTYYVTAETQLDDILRLATHCSPEYVGKVAVYARQFGYMKDVPALLTAYLAAKDLTVFKKVFPAVIDDFKMLRNFVQAVRSGKVGRKSFGTAVKRQIQAFLDSKTDNEVFRGSIGNDPSLPDIIKMVHPHPKTVGRSNLYSYLLGKKFVLNLLPEDAREFELFKNNPSGNPPGINFQFLSNVKMSADQWRSLAQTMSWHTLRMNLNTLARNGVFETPAMAHVLAAKLADKEQIHKSKVFPYQLLAAFLNATDVPVAIKNGLQDAMEVAVSNVPAFNGKTVVAVDTSGSMGSPVTGHRPGATSTVRCVDVAGLMAASVLRKNDDAVILPFDTTVHPVRDLNGRDTVMTNAQKLARSGGGTDCASALRYLNEHRIKADNVIFVSDNESWVQSAPSYSASYYRGGTGMHAEWLAFKKRNPGAKLVCIDITPGASTQVVDSSSVLNVGGFNDRVFDIVAAFLNGELNAKNWEGLINKVQL